jgi:hypothetical protein
LEFRLPGNDSLTGNEHIVNATPAPAPIQSNSLVSSQFTKVTPTTTVVSATGTRRSNFDKSSFIVHVDVESVDSVPFFHDARPTEPCNQIMGTP